MNSFTKYSMVTLLLCTVGYTLIMYNTKQDSNNSEKLELESVVEEIHSDHSIDKNEEEIVDNSVDIVKIEQVCENLLKEYLNESNTDKQIEPTYVMISEKIDSPKKTKTLWEKLWFINTDKTKE